MIDLERVSVDEERYMNELVEEAIEDLLKKYRDKEKGKRASVIEVERLLPKSHMKGVPHGR